MPQGEVVALVVREDLWTSQLARTFREAGGAFVAHERFGAAAVPDADEAPEGTTSSPGWSGSRSCGGGTCSRTPSSRSRRRSCWRTEPGPVGSWVF